MGAFMARLRSLISQEYGVKGTDMTGEVRTQHVAAARQVAYYISREITSLSWKAIGDYFNKDHSMMWPATNILPAIDAREAAIRGQDTGIDGRDGD